MPYFLFREAGGSIEESVKANGALVGRRAVMGVVRLIAPLVVICFATGALFAQTPALQE